MLMQEATPKMVAAWKDTFEKYRDKLRPNRKTGAEVVAYLNGKYPLRELCDDEAKQVVIDNVLLNEPFASRLPEGSAPSAVAFLVENEGAGKALYEAQDDIFKGIEIFVGVELLSGFFSVEGSSLLWDELYAFRGLDEADLQNYYCVAEYVACLKRFNLLEKTLR